jgi:4-amino-4-deoxy-L-arabinose transferase-like glycosyltransferase
VALHIPPQKKVAIALAAIIAASMGLSIYWVFKVPIFEAPDEPGHLDYALNIYSAGRLISVREPLQAWNGPVEDRHVFTQYLVDESREESIAFHHSVKAPPGYGTREFYGRVDLNAPAEHSGGLAGTPRTHFGYLTVYPMAYYSVLAAWMKLISVFSRRITVLFFGARLLSVVLLGCSLVLMYATARELHFTSGRALLVTGIAGLFPMTTFVSAYVQPDNLSLLLVMLCCYLALRLRRDPDNGRFLWGLGLSLGFLWATKYQFFAATSLPVFAMAIVDQMAGRRRKIGWRKLVTVLIAPTLILMCVQLWIGYGAGAYPVFSQDHNTLHPDLARAMRDGKWAVVSFLGDGAAYAFSNFYLKGGSLLNGSTFASFWGNFGWLDTPLTIMTPWKNAVIRNLIALLDVVVFGLTLIRLEQVFGRLISVARRGRWKRALCIAFSNPLMNAYFLFTVMMFGLFMVVRLSFGPQGRNWFPFILAIFMVGPDYASKALSQKVARRVLRLVVLGGLVLYCIVGSYYAIRSIDRRYYGPAETAFASPAVPQVQPAYADTRK